MIDSCERCGRPHEQENSHQLFKCGECDSILCANQVIRPKGRLATGNDHKWIHQSFARPILRRPGHRLFNCGPVEPVWRNLAGVFRTGVACSRCEGAGEVVTIVLVPDNNSNTMMREQRCVNPCDMCRGLGFTGPAFEASRIFRATPSESVYIPCSSGV